MHYDPSHAGKYSPITAWLIKDSNLQNRSGQNRKPHTELRAKIRVLTLERPV